LKPGFFKNEDLAKISCEGRLLFAGLWGLADREGRLEDRPSRIRAELFPYEPINVDRLLQELAAAGFIRRYVVDQRACLCIPTFRNHQQPHLREAPSILPPAPDEHWTSTGLAPDQHQTSPPVLVLDPVTVLDPVSDPVNSIQTKERTPVSSPVDLDLSGLRSRATGEDAGAFTGKKR
jgi:hypothetical protein